MNQQEFPSINEIIRNGRTQGLSNDEISHNLNRSGLKTVTGLPFTSANVAMIAIKHLGMPRKVNRKRSPQRPVAPVDDQTTDVNDIRAILDSSISERNKLFLIEVLARGKK